MNFWRRLLLALLPDRENDRLRARLDATVAALDRIRREDPPTDEDWRLAAADPVLTGAQPAEAAVIASAALARMRGAR